MREMLHAFAAQPLSTQIELLVAAVIVLAGAMSGAILTYVWWRERKWDRRSRPDYYRDAATSERQARVRHMNRVPKF